MIEVERETRMVGRRGRTRVDKEIGPSRRSNRNEHIAGTGLVQVNAETTNALRAIKDYIGSGSRDKNCGKTNKS